MRKRECLTAFRSVFGAIRGRVDGRRFLPSARAGAEISEGAISSGRFAVAAPIEGR